MLKILWDGTLVPHTQSYFRASSTRIGNLFCSSAHRCKGSESGSIAGLYPLFLSSSSYKYASCQASSTYAMTIQPHSLQNAWKRCITMLSWNLRFKPWPERPFAIGLLTQSLMLMPTSGYEAFGPMVATYSLIQGCSIPTRQAIGLEAFSPCTGNSSQTRSVSTAN